MKIAPLIFLTVFSWQATAMAEDKPTINVTSTNQSGGITAYQVTVGRMDLTFTEEVTTALVKLLPKNIPIEVNAVGSNRDIAVAMDYVRYLETAGYSIKAINRIGMLAPPPDSPISVRTTPAATIVTIAPRA